MKNVTFVVQLLTAVALVSHVGQANKLAEVVEYEKNFSTTLFYYTHLHLLYCSRGDWGLKPHYIRIAQAHLHTCVAT